MVTVSVCGSFSPCLFFLMAKKSQTNPDTFLAVNNSLKVHGDAKAALSDDLGTDYINRDDAT